MPDYTRDEIEAMRYEAHLQAQQHSNFPTELTINQISIPLAKYAELEKLNTKVIKNKALNLRDAVEATKSRFFEHHAKLARVPHQSDQIASWMIQVQVLLCQALGWELDEASFGLPQGDESHLQSAPQEQRSFASTPCWAQAEAPAPLPQKPRQQAPWFEDENYGQHARRQQQAPMADESRFNDAARIKARSNAATFTLG